VFRVPSPESRVPNLPSTPRYPDTSTPSPRLCVASPSCLRASVPSCLPPTSDMAIAPPIPITLNGHAMPHRNGSASSPNHTDSSPCSPETSVFNTSSSTPQESRSLPSSVSSVLSVVNSDLLCDLLAGEFLLPYIAARHNVPLSALNAWVESDEVQSLLASCRRISEWRARFIALDSIPRSIHGLITTMNQCPGTEKARRAATTIINLAFKKDLSIPLGATGRARSDERDQCRSPHAPRHHSGSTHPTSDIAHPTSHSPSHPLTSSPSHPSHDWPARSARGSSQTSPSLSDAARAETPVPESSTPVSGSFSVQVPEHQDSSASSARSAVHPLPDSRAPT